MIKKHVNDNGIAYYSKQADEGKIFSFSQDFEDYWTEDDEALHTRKPMQVIEPLHPTVSSCGPILRGEVRVNDLDYTVEASTERDWLAVIGEDSNQDSFRWDIENNTLVGESFAGVTDAWSSDALDTLDTLLRP
jgi:hypothetical protein